MPTPAQLALSHTDLKPEELEHLQRLLGSWSVLADLSFSDLLLLVPVRSRATDGTGEVEDPELVVLGQMRPNNRPTLVDQDLVGQTVNESQWALVARCLHTGEIVRGSIHHPILGEQVPVENVPVRYEERVIAVLLRVSLAPLKGPTSMYERTYLDVFERLADMVAQSAFPFPDEDIGTEEAPRVGDGVVVVERGEVGCQRGRLHRDVHARYRAPRVAFEHGIVRPRRRRVHERREQRVDARRVRVGLGRGEGLLAKKK